MGWKENLEYEAFLEVKYEHKLDIKSCLNRLLFPYLPLGVAK